VRENVFVGNIEMSIVPNTTSISEIYLAAILNGPNAVENICGNIAEIGGENIIPKSLILNSRELIIVSEIYELYLLEDKNES
jgi:hypothetical protein